MLEYKGYHASITYNDKDQLLVGKVIGISDDIAFHGTSVEEMKHKFHDAVDDYLDFCKEVGKNPDKEYRGTFNVRINPALHKKLAEKAYETHHSLNAAVEEAISEYVS